MTREQRRAGGMLRSMIAPWSAAACLALAGCAAALPFGAGSALHVDVPIRQAGVNAAPAGHPFKLALADFVDGRPGSPGRRIGDIRATVRDMHGTELLLDQDVSDLIAAAVKRQLNADGIDVVAPGAPADVDLAGTIRAFSLNIAGRDERQIAVDAMLRDRASGRTVWAGALSANDDRYAGVAGNSRASIAAYLGEGVAGIAADLSTTIRSRMAAHPPQPTPSPRSATDALPAAVSAPVPSTATDQKATSDAHVAPAAQDRAATRGQAGKFVLRSTPARAQVYVGEVYYGLTPLEVSLPIGVNTVSVRLKGHRTVIEKVSIRPEETTELELDFERER